MGTQVATIQAPRLPFHPIIEEQYGYGESAWKALTNAVFPLAKTAAAIELALSYCKARKMDPFKRVVHIVPIWDKESRSYLETVWPGIAEQRITAFRTGQYIGCDPAVFGPTFERQFQTEDGKVTVTFPEWCQITVTRLVAGREVKFHGPRVYWLETYAKRGKSPAPNDMWAKRSFGQIEKCAEAAALRKAFPEELGGEMTAEEAEGAFWTDPAADVSPERPTRAQFTPSEPIPETPAAASTPADGQAGGEALSPASPPAEPKKMTLREWMASFKASLEVCRSQGDISELVSGDAQMMEWLSENKPAVRDEVDALIADRSAAIEGA